VRLLVLDDLRGADLPQRRPLGMDFARFAGGVDAAIEHRHRAGRALDARRGEACALGADRLDPLGETGGEIVGEIEPFRVGDIALLVGQLGAAFGVKALGGAVVDDAVRLQDAVLVIELDAADGGDRVVVLVVDELVGFDDELVGVARRRPLGRRRLGERGASYEDEGEAQRQTCERTAAAVPAGVGRADGPGHQPSSWCRST
jgi:hypothetical protein